MPPQDSWASSPRVRAVMKGNRSSNTQPELAIRRRLHREGYRYFINRRPLAGFRRSADLVFPSAKVAVFIDGCFWHGCPDHYVAAKTNVDYWAAKIARNRQRDQQTDKELQAADWTVVRLWEHTSTGDAVTVIKSAVQRGRRHCEAAAITRRNVQGQ